jgi:hypothetical protein
LLKTSFLGDSFRLDLSSVREHCSGIESSALRLIV